MSIDGRPEGCLKHRIHPVHCHAKQQKQIFKLCHKNIVCLKFRCQSTIPFPGIATGNGIWLIHLESCVKSCKRLFLSGSSDKEVSSGKSNNAQYLIAIMAKTDTIPSSISTFFNAQRFHPMLLQQGHYHTGQSTTGNQTSSNRLCQFGIFSFSFAFCPPVCRAGFQRHRQSRSGVVARGKNKHRKTIDLTSQSSMVMAKNTPTSTNCQSKDWRIASLDQSSHQRSLWRIEFFATACSIPLLAVLLADYQEIVQWLW